MIGRVYHLSPRDLELLTFDQFDAIAEDMRALEAAAKADLG